MEVTGNLPEEPTRHAGRLAGLAVTLLALAVVLLACWLLYRIEARQVIDEQRQRESTRISLLANLMTSRLQTVAIDLRLLADSDGMRAWLRSGSSTALAAATRRARFISLNHPAYDQIRFIDASGKEILRVDQGGRVVQRELLQDKAGRDYFQQTISLPAGSFYVSDLDLNIENGRVERPLKPTLRLAAPVFDASGARRGICIVNYLGAKLIRYLQHAVPANSDRMRLLDSNGYWIRAASPDQEWGSILPGRADFTMARSNPGLWAQVQRQQEGQELGKDLFTWRKVRPATLIGDSAATLVARMPWMVVASDVPQQELMALTAGLRQVMSLVVPGLMLLTLLSAWLLRARRKALGALRAMNQQLELRVSERTAELARSYKELQDREALQEETGQLAKVGGWEFDPQTGKGMWTAEIARIHDLPDTLEPSRDLGLQFYPGESRTRIEAALQRSLVDGSAYDLELEFISAKGVHKWVRTIGRPEIQDGRVVRMRGAFQDVTERKLSELRVHAQLQRMHLLERTTRAIGERQDLASILLVVIHTLEEQLPLDLCCVCLYETGAQELTVTSVGAASDALARKLGLGVGERIALDADGLSRCVRGQLVYEPDVEQVQFPFPQRLASGGLHSLVAAPLHVEKQVFGVLVAARFNANGFTGSDCEFLRQLSEHVALAAHQAQLHEALQAAYDDLRNTQQAVMQQERLRVLGQMASGIAHDINNAISPIMLYTDALLERRPELDAQAMQSLRTIQQAASDVAETVARMREFYRQPDSRGEPQAVDLNALVVQVRDLTRARWETIPQQQGIVIDLRLELLEGLPTILGMESEIREALINLVFNSVDAMPGGGRLTISTELGAQGRVALKVSDSGTGMDEQTRRHCLEPFFTTKGERGTGLGLAMVYGVMQRHGGEVAIASKPDEGTTVELTFAISDRPLPDASGITLALPGPLNILLVDDDPILLRSLSEILKLDGHSFTATEGGRQGIEAFRASLQPGASPYSLVITDLGMPHVDGREVARTVKQLAPATPVILLTGWGERLLTEGHAVAHMDRILGKPPRLRDLRRALAELTNAAS